MIAIGDKERMNRHEKKCAIKRFALDVVESIQILSSKGCIFMKRKQDPVDKNSF